VTPLRDIRRQGKRLVDALLTVPEAPPKTIPELPIAEPVDDVVRTPFAYVWVLRDAKAHLDDAASQAIIAGLNIQMREKQWDIQTLQVHEDYVYLLADVPGEDPAYQIIRDLKRRSAEIAHAQNSSFVSDGLWADSYLVVTPGRELDTEEIQQFISFERME
jgi:REP element-mobilizing transposase RayT